MSVLKFESKKARYLFEVNNELMGLLRAQYQSLVNTIVVFPQVNYDNISKHDYKRIKAMESHIKMMMDNVDSFNLELSQNPYITSLDMFCSEKDGELFFDKLTNFLTKGIEEYNI